MLKKVLVVGANFINKGAQSMLFIVTDEVKKRYPDCEIYFACNNEKYVEEDYKFKKLFYTKQSQDLVLKRNKGNFQVMKTSMVNLVRLILGRSDDFFRMYDAEKIIPSMDLIIDISGYALADICGPMEHEYYLDNIRIAKEYNIPIILMPQSFGPFNYCEENMYLMDEIKELLPYCKAIYAREEDGYNYLKNFGLTNLYHSVDLVLQNKRINRSNICTQSYQINNYIIKENSVAVIPNYHCFTEEFKEHSFELYRQIISKLLRKEKNIYIFRHASLDLNICKQIKEMFKWESRVCLIEEEFDCIEYDELVQKFEFIICSRYHGCVHAYKKHIPCIILGWAVKYRELAKLLDQEEYIFNILSKECNDSKLLAAVDYMLEHYSDEKNNIKCRLKKAQKNNCFEILDEIKW